MNPSSTMTRRKAAPRIRSDKSTTFDAAIARAVEGVSSVSSVSTSSDVELATTRSGAFTVSLARLDRRLATFARRPDRFAHDAARLGRAWDARLFDLEIADPASWRRSVVGRRVGVERQFRAEIEGMLAMDADEEVRLALRIEFARLRLDSALALDGSSTERPHNERLLAPLSRRRWLEWHSLRVELAERNLYLVLRSVERFRHTPCDRFDLMQAAAGVLLRAVDGFDWRHGVLFRTYAVHWLNQGFRDHLYNFGRTVRVPVHLQKSAKHVHRAIALLGDPHASVDEIALTAGLSKKTVVAARSAFPTVRSIDSLLDGTNVFTDDVALARIEDGGETALDGVSVARGLAVALERLNDRELRVVSLRFGLGASGEREHVYAEIADDLGISLERVRQILQRAMVKMRTPQLRKLFEPSFD